jgi:hypothetical protein
MLALGDDQLPMAEVTLAAAGPDILVPPEMGVQGYADFALGIGATVALMSTAWTMKGTDPGSDYCCASMNLCAQANAFFNRMWLVVSNHCETRRIHRRGLLGAQPDR